MKRQNPCGFCLRLGLVVTGAINTACAYAHNGPAEQAAGVVRGNHRGPQAAALRATGKSRAIYMSDARALRSPDQIAPDTPLRLSVVAVRGASVAARWNERAA